jgi:hypothetical protein
MRIGLLISALFMVLPGTLGIPKPTPFGHYIVTLKPGVSKAKHLEWLSAARLGPAVDVTYDKWNSDILNGFAARLDDIALQDLRSHPDVESIEEDAVFTIDRDVRSDLKARTIQVCLT